MKILRFSYVTRQLREIKHGGLRILARKLRRPLLLPFALPVCFLIRILRPWVLVRIEDIGSSMGPLAYHPELYLCERESGIGVPNQRYVDIFYAPEDVCNRQLLAMWKRVLPIWPYWTFGIVAWLNDKIPGGKAHHLPYWGDRDVYNVLEKTKPHLKFTEDEERLGKAGLVKLGIPPGARFVCLLVRDDAYGNQSETDRYHREFRNCDIDNYVLAVQELVKRGYFVVRMGAKAKKPLKIYHPSIIDYAMNGERDELMDIYLGAYCEFTVTTGSGWDSIPWIFRKPQVTTNIVPAIQAVTYSSKALILLKRHIDRKTGLELPLSRIFESGVGFLCRTYYYDLKDIQLIENSPEEIRDAVVEMIERLSGTWKPMSEDESLQSRFWTIYPTKTKRQIVEAYPSMLSEIPASMLDRLNGYEREYDEEFKKDFWKVFPKSYFEVYSERPMHGDIVARFGAKYLRDNREWLS